MGGYCWQGNITLPPEDFARLNMEARQKGAEAEIIININDMKFKILAEESGDERKFGQKSYTIKGRSLTARLGEDYATRAGQLYSAPIYAQQIVREQLKAPPIGWCRLMCMARATKRLWPLSAILRRPPAHLWRATPASRR
jgi:hypothetical protein